MKLGAYFNVFDGEELLEGAIDCIREHVDYVFCMVQTKSFNGEEYFGGYQKVLSLFGDKVDNHVLYNDLNNEREKRQVAINHLKDVGCTHFIGLDCDEYYHNFGDAKEYYLDNYMRNTAVKMKTYFKEPTLQIEGFDNYYVPFISELNRGTITGHRNFKNYCGDGVWVDPTRSVNGEHAELLPDDYHMHHFSYIRKDINRKVNNSTAKNNILNSDILKDYSKAKEGYRVKHWDKNLILVPNLFNIEV